MKTTKKTDAKEDQNARGAGIAAAAPKADMVMVPIDAIDVVDNVRTTMDETALFELAESMKSVGLLEPVIVHKAGKRFAMIAGHRRLAAAKQNGDAFIEAKVFGSLDEGTVARMQLAENLQREDLNHIDIARKLGAARDAGISIAAIASDINVSDDYVRRHLDLLRLDGRVAKLVASGRLPVKHAELISRIGESKKQIELAERVCGAASWFGAKDRNAALAGDTVITLDDLRKEVAQAMQSLAAGRWPMGEDFAAKRPCDGCPDNTATYADHPKLFEGITPRGSDKKGYCTNGDCFEIKLKAWEKGEAKRKAAAEKELARQIASAKKNGLTICDGCGKTGGDIVGAEVAVAFGAIKTAGTFDLCPACRKKNEKLAKRSGGGFNSYDHQKQQSQLNQRKKNFPETPEEKQAVAMYDYACKLIDAIGKTVAADDAINNCPGVLSVAMMLMLRGYVPSEEKFIPKTMQELITSDSLVSEMFLSHAIVYSYREEICRVQPRVGWDGQAQNVPTTNDLTALIAELECLARAWKVADCPTKPCPPRWTSDESVATQDENADADEPAAADEKPKRKKRTIKYQPTNVEVTA